MTRNADAMSPPQDAPQVPRSRADERSMDFTACPYDAHDLDAEDYSGGSVVLRCGWCGAAWEWHNAWIRRIAEPDRDKVVAASDRPNPGRNADAVADPATAAGPSRRP